MKKLIQFELAGKLVSLVFSILILFHSAIILGILLFDFAPVDFLWGGRMQNAVELLQFEILSLCIMVLFYTIVRIRTGKIHWPRFLSFTPWILWLMTAMFVLNTLGNLLAESLFEKFFALITFLLALLCARLAMEKIKTQS